MTYVPATSGVNEAVTATVTRPAASEAIVVPLVYELLTFDEPDFFAKVTGLPAEVIGDEKIVPESTVDVDASAAIAEYVRSTVEATETEVLVEATAADPAVNESDVTAVACDATAETPPNDNVYKDNI